MSNRTSLKCAGKKDPSKQPQIMDVVDKMVQTRMSQSIIDVVVPEARDQIAQLLQTNERT
jgi:hypothetical protein